jgi:hypothetical protein
LLERTRGVSAPSFCFLFPFFDHEPVASVGALAVAPSNHNIIYVGSGEGCIRDNIIYGKCRHENALVFEDEPKARSADRV